MSRRVHLAPMAITSDGDVLLNAATIAGATDLEAVVRAAKNDGLAVFVGVILSPRETEFVLSRLDNAADEAAARLVGQRRRRAVTRSKRTTRS